MAEQGPKHALVEGSPRGIPRPEVRGRHRMQRPRLQWESGVTFGPAAATVAVLTLASGPAEGQPPTVYGSVRPPVEVQQLSPRQDSLNPVIPEGVAPSDPLGSLDNAPPFVVPKRIDQ